MKVGLLICGVMLSESDTKAKIGEIFKRYNSDIQKVGRSYRYA